MATDVQRKISILSLLTRFLLRLGNLWPSGNQNTWMRESVVRSAALPASGDVSRLSPKCYEISTWQLLYGLHRLLMYGVQIPKILHPRHLDKIFMCAPVFKNLHRIARTCMHIGNNNVSKIEMYQTYIIHHGNRQWQIHICLLLSNNNNKNGTGFPQSMGLV